MDAVPVVRLKCHYNNYGWGKMGAKSEVARLFAAGHSSFEIEEKPYSELWMGTHPDGPALVKDLEMKLSTFIAKTHSENNLLSEHNNNMREEGRSEIHLPFIMKVMSIDKTLSLQVHPTKEQASRLHDKDPYNYPDRNHKPELAYALTEFELLCGFRPAEEMLRNLEAFPSLRCLFGEKCQRMMVLLREIQDPHSLACKVALAQCFSNMMKLDRFDVKSLIRELLNSLEDGVRGALKESTVDVIRKMSFDFPGDVGVFSPLFLNHMILQPGECCYYAAEELHAYLSGECVECVGCSNNTLRAAMTPKFIDRENVCEVLNYRMTNPSEYLVPACNLEGYPYVDEYAPDCKDFQLHRIRVPRGARNAYIPPLDCGSIMVIHSGKAVLEGEEPCPSSYNRAHSVADLQRMNGLEVQRGDIFYIRPGRRIRFTSCSEPVQAFRTFSYEEGPDHESRNVVCKRHLNGIDFERIADAPIRPRFDLGNSRESGIFEVDSEMDGFL